MKQMDCLQSDAPNYIKASEGASEICTNCRFGQPPGDLFCDLFTCLYTKGFICDRWEAIPILKQQIPYGYLIHKGKKTAIASDEPYLAGTKMLLVEDGKAYGTVVLEQPAVMTIEYFEKSEAFNRHRVTPDDRLKLWPDAKSLYTQRISRFEPFVSAIPVEIKDEVVSFKEYQPIIDHESELIRAVDRLPKKIVLSEAAICLTGSKFYEDCKEDFLTLSLGNSRSLNYLKKFIQEKLGSSLKGIFGIEPQYTNKIPCNHLPLYELALLRKYKPQIQKEEGTPDFEFMKKGIRRKDNIDFIDIKAQHSRSACMECKSSPVIDVHWADGRGRAWFCARHFKVWIKEEREIVRAWYVEGNEVPTELNEHSRKRQIRVSGSGKTQKEILNDLEKRLGKTIKEAKQMPFEIVERENEICVINLDTNMEVLCYGGSMAMDEARTLLAALMINDKQDDEEAEEVEDEETEEAGIYDEDEDKQFSDDEWDGSAGRWDTAEAFCKDSLIDVNPSGEEKTKALCFLPFRDPGTQIPNRNAVQAIGGGRGITALEKPSEVDGERWNKQLEAAANKIIGWWPDAFDKPAPEAIFGIVGKERPGEKQADKIGRAIIDKGGILDEILFVYVDKENGDIYYADVGDWAGAETYKALKKVFSSIQIEAENPPHPAEKWQEIWPIKSSNRKYKGEKSGKRLKGSMLKKLQDAMEVIKALISWGSYEEEKEPKFKDFVEGIVIPSFDVKENDGFAIKMVNGKPWHLSWSTNAFEDRHKEMFSTKSLENYVIAAEKKEDRGYFNFWHIATKEQPDLSDFAEKRFQAVLGRFLFEAGPYLDNHKGRSALKFFSEYSGGHPELAPEGWGASPEFLYLPEERETGTFNTIWITRTSTLPREEAANIWTEAKQEDIMALSDQQKKAAIALFGAEYVEKNMIEEGDERTAALEEAGVAHKSNDEVKRFAEAIKEVAGKIEDGEERGEIEKVLEDLSEKNLEERGQELLVISEKLGDLKSEVKSIAEAMIGGDVEEEVVEEEEAAIDVDQLVETIAEKAAEIASGNVTIDMEPIAEALAVMAVAVEEIKQDLATVKETKALQAETQLPKYIHTITQRASDSEKTVVTEDDPLGKQKPEEAIVKKGKQTMADHYFPKPK